MGRHKGSKNKIKKNLQPQEAKIKRGRGRPRKVLQDDEVGIKKHNTLLPILFRHVKDLKREIRKLRKLKVACRAGSKERIDLHRKIKDLQKQLTALQSRKPTTDTKYIPKTHKVADKIKVEINPDESNGCSYQAICKATNLKIENKTCFNPLYFIDKLGRKCKELKTESEG